MAAQQRHLGINHGVFAAAVMIGIVGDQDLHRADASGRRCIGCCVRSIQPGILDSADVVINRRRSLNPL
jgi:hypothetical protein